MFCYFLSRISIPSTVNPLDSECKAHRLSDRAAYLAVASNPESLAAVHLARLAAHENEIQDSLCLVVTVGDDH